jgi:hypothetical protein
MSRNAYGAVQATNATFTSSVQFVPEYIANNNALGTYYTLKDETGVLVKGGRPIAPLMSENIYIPGTIAHGVLWTGGTFTEVVNFDPVVSRIVTEETYIDVEPGYPSLTWDPTQIGNINRLLLASEGTSLEQLVVVPAQFRARNSDSAPTTGIQRLYTDLNFEVYHTPFTVTDFLAPNIWSVRAISSSQHLRFDVLVDDDADSPEDSGEVARVIVLYRQAEDRVWQKAELTLLGKDEFGIEVAEVFVDAVDSPIHYFAQAVDDSGNVLLSLNHGMPYTEVEVEQGILPDNNIYLPLVVRN